MKVSGFFRRFERCVHVALCVSAFAFLFGAAADLAKAQDENFESSAPVLISETDSVRALTANPSSWRGSLPRLSSGEFTPGSRVMVFAANVSLLKDEEANAFRVYAEDDKGNAFRLTVEQIQPVLRENGIYALTFRIYDENGYNGQPESGNLLIRTTWRGNTSNKVLLGSGKFDEKVLQNSGLTPTPAASIRAAQTANALSSGGDRKRFMEQAAFGPNAALDLRLRQLGLNRWIEDQVIKPYPTIPYPNFPQKSTDGVAACGGEYDTSPEVNLCYRNHLWQYNNQNWLVKEAFYGDDQLRRKVSWALHKIWVVSATTVYQQRWMQEYVEILDRNAFGNYRDLMKEMTLSPAMGEYLDMVRSTKNNPNENYPREILQLFTVGLYKLNQDGTYALDGQGSKIPTYDQSKLEQFTKVFTGWTQCTTSTCPNATVGIPNFIDPMYLAFPNNHDQTAKTLFDYAGAPNQTIAACTNCTTDANRIAYANDSLNKTLDNIFYHPNVAPFVGKLLIQHLVTSDPSPAYVSRVAAAFNNNGYGVRGDMKAVVKAILLDPEARGSRKTDPNYGKLREPLQYMTNFLRTFNVRASTPITVGGSQVSPPASCQNKSDGVLSYYTYEQGQDILVPATVFSYFPPDYVVPGTDVLGPEFALANTSTSVARNNHVMGFSFGWNWFEQTTASNPYPYTPCGTSIDLTEPTSWAAADSSGNTLVENLNTKMMHGTMSDAMKSKILAAINYNVSAQQKASQAIFLIVSSSQYQIQR